MATQAYLCSDCGWADKATECVKCGKSFADVDAKLCDTCGWGNKATECVKCGKPFAEVPGKLCSDCGFNSRVAVPSTANCYTGAKIDIALALGVN